VGKGGSEDEEGDEDGKEGVGEVPLLDVNQEGGDFGREGGRKEGGKENR